MKTLILIVLSILFSIATSLPEAYGATNGEAQLARFNAWLKIVESSLGSSEELDEVAEALLNGETRVASFNLQALGRLYSDTDPIFVELRNSFKKMEDSIGDFDKWSKVLKEAIKQGKDDTTIEKLQDRVDKARSAFIAFLKSEKWVVTNGKTKISLIKEKLSKYEWQAYLDDKKTVLKETRKQLKKIETTEFDMTILEEGDGLHELRRELRWFLLEARALNGLITFDSKIDQFKRCPIKEFAELLNNKEVADSKYAKLPLAKTEIDPCFISQCLYLGVVDAVAKLGELKDKAEVANNMSGKPTSDEVPEELVEEAQGIYTQITETGLLTELVSEIKSCK